MLISTSQGNFIIREAGFDDIDALVQVHVTSWNVTYPGYHPKPSVELRTSQWKKYLLEKPGNWFCYLVEKDDGEVVGFSTGSDFNDSELPYKAELNKIHFLKSYQRLGLGKQLVCTVVNRFLKNDLRSMILFADPQNPNILFYEKLGGQRLYDKEGNFHGAYGWKDINLILERCS